MSLSRIDPDPRAGFEYPYYLNVPDAYAGERPILVAPTNSGQPSDDFVDHRTDAEKRAKGGMGRRIADELSVPFLHPVFPRPVSDPEDWTHYVHQLDAQTLQIDEGALQRVDLQLLAMVDDAREQLSNRDDVIPERILLNGFSASGAFVNRFSVLHPDRVRSVSAGGINGMVTLPREEVQFERDLAFADRLPMYYPVGIADVEALSGEPFDADAFQTVRQFVYMGEDDDKDVLLWPDAWTDPERRASAIFTYGPDVHDDRFPTCASIYAEEDLPAVFRTYPDTGHKPAPAFDDIVRFHELSIAGADVGELEDAIGGNPVV